MMNIEVLGTGCAKCRRLQKNVERAVKVKGVQAEISKVEDINDILATGVMITPGLVIDGKVVSSGKVPSVDDIIDLL